MNPSDQAIPQVQRKPHQFNPQVQAFTRWWLIWVFPVQMPLLAFSFGASLAHSWWVIVPMLLCLLVTHAVPAFAAVAVVIAAIVYFASNDPWLACFFAGLGFAQFVESRANYMHTEAQTKPILSDLLSPISPFAISEIEVPPQVLEGFPDYLRKEKARQLMEKFGRRRLSERELLPVRAKVIRMFRFEPINESQSVGAAVAYPIHRYSSLVFVRQSFEKLNDAQRFQIYHELAHGTLEGTDVLMKPLRWKAIATFAHFFSFAIFLACCVGLYQNPSRWTVLALGTVGLANLLRLQVEKQVIALSLASSEVMADSIALMHPDFADGEQWKIRASNQKKRLEDELEFIGIHDPRDLQVFFRKEWLGRWLRLGRVPPYLASNVDPRILPACVLYIVAGYLATIPVVFSTFTVWAALVSVVGCNLILGWYGWRSNTLTLMIHDALEEKLT